MSDIIPSSPVPGGAAGLLEPAPPDSIFRTWVRAITRPSEATYREIGWSTHASTGNAFLWYALAAFVQALCTSLAGGGAETDVLRLLGTGEQPTPMSFGERAAGAVCAVPFAVVVSLLGFAVMLGLMHLIARAFGGRATFDQLAYVSAAIYAPAMFIGSVFVLLGAIPVVGLCFNVLVVAISLYALGLEIIAVKAVHVISWGGAVVAALLLPVGVFLCVACATIALLMLLGPAIGQVFSSINGSLQGVP